ncbi:MAG: sigma-70 family RNA polymerase sigma factor [Desulfocapsa sp.]|nr:sigma-70 family RNA polymerase sigma factor [Desulfocapsa sp.]
MVYTQKETIRNSSKVEADLPHPCPKHDKQPPSLVEQHQQSAKLLNQEDEVRYAKTIRDNFFTIVENVKQIHSPSKQILALQKTVASWETKDNPIKPGKRRLDYILNTLESVCSKHPYDMDTHFLCKQFKTLGSEIETAKDILITTNLRLVCSIAKRYTDKGLSLADLTQEGCIGLMRAVFRFDHTTGKRFSTYASWWIRQAITRAIPEKTRTIKLPAHFLVSRNHFNKTFSGLRKQLGRKPTMTELSRDTYMPYKKILSIIETSTEPVSLEEPVGENSMNLMQLLENRNATLPDDIAITTDLRTQIDNILSTLSTREAQVLRLRFGIGGKNECTLDEVGKQFNVSRERIRQIEQEALQRLRHPSRSDHMRCFLESN